ncbi:MAG: deoxyribonuclease IV [Planctomycetota bacterium]
MPLLGAHLSIAGGYERAAESAASFQMDSVQIFTASPQIWAVSGGATGSTADWISKPIDATSVARFREVVQSRKLTRTVAHSSYLINLGSSDDFLWRRSVAAMTVELQRAAQLGLFGVIVHPGAATSGSDEAAIGRVIAAINEIHQRLPADSPAILLENTAGQGSCLGWRFEHLADMIHGARHPDRLGVCFDTCHAFAAGYPLATAADYEQTMTQFDELVGLRRLRAFHLNDSKRELGSRVDRHEHIGQGHIGLDAFAYILRDPRLAHLPMFLETPKGKHGTEEWDAINLRILRDLAAGQPVTVALSSPPSKAKTAVAQKTGTSKSAQKKSAQKKSAEKPES